MEQQGPIRLLAVETSSSVAGAAVVVGGKLAAEGRFGVTVALVGNQITFNALADIAGKYKLVDPENEVVKAAEGIGICLGR